MLSIKIIKLTERSEFHKYSIFNSHFHEIAGFFSELQAATLRPAKLDRIRRRKLQFANFAKMVAVNG
jgi:hypothetical protein